MKIDAGFTLLFSDEGLRLEVRDRASGITFIRAELDTEQACQLMSRVSGTDSTITEVYGLENVGKQLILHEEIFEIPKEHSGYKVRKEFARKYITEKYQGTGMSPDTHFGSQNSFFTKEGVEYARTTIREWVVQNEKLDFNTTIRTEVRPVRLSKDVLEFQTWQSDFMSDKMRQISKQIGDLQNKAIRGNLIAMGWAPPEYEGIPRDGYLEREYYILSQELNDWKSRCIVAEKELKELKTSLKSLITGGLE